MLKKKRDSIRATPQRIPQSQSSIVLATLCLNEMQWLPRLYEQHKTFPGLVKWVFVESADKVYAQTNPHLTNNGLSVDGTTEFLTELAKQDNRIVHIPYGYSNIANRYPEDQGKCESRNRYLDIAKQLKPDLLVILDADEFYTRQHQKILSNILSITSSNISTRLNFKGSAFCFKQRHIWHPPCFQGENHKSSQYRLQYPFLSQEVIGGYWDVIHCRVWKWESGLRYQRNHNWPEDKDGNFLIHKGERMMRTDGSTPVSLSSFRNRGGLLPECIHFGYASNASNRVAKHKYYEERGEGKEPDRSIQKRRMMYVECRNDYLVWEPGNHLSHEAKVIPYTGPIPEIFRSEIVPPASHPIPDDTNDIRQSVDRLEQFFSSGEHAADY